MDILIVALAAVLCAIGGIHLLREAWVARHREPPPPCRPIRRSPRRKRARTVELLARADVREAARLSGSW